MKLNKFNKRLIAARRPFSVVEIKNDPSITKQNGNQSSYSIVVKNGSGIAEFGCAELAATWFCEAANRYADEIYSRVQPTNEQETHEAVVKLARRELEDHERINCWFRPEFVRALIDRLEAAHRCEAQSIERIVRDAIIDYNEMYSSAPNDEVERDLRERAARANAWLKQHGFKEEPFHWSKEETPCL